MKDFPTSYIWALCKNWKKKKAFSLDFTWNSPLTEANFTYYNKCTAESSLGVLRPVSQLAGKPVSQSVGLLYELLVSRNQSAEGFRAALRRSWESKGLCISMVVRHKMSQVVPLVFFKSDPLVIQLWLSQRSAVVSIVAYLMSWWELPPADTGKVTEQYPPSPRHPSIPQHTHT